MVDHSDLEGIVSEDVARRIIARARTFAPCLRSLTAESESGKDAIALLKGVIAELPAAGASRTRSLARNGTAITYADITSAFDPDTVTSLRALCRDSSAGLALPRGSFPKHQAFKGIWPEGDYS